jgi:uncharacterized protein
MEKRKHSFLFLAVAFESALILPALLLALFFKEARWWNHLQWDSEALVIGFLATFPVAILGALLVSESGRRFGFSHRIFERLKSALGKEIRKLPFFQIVLISCLAGLGEEILFRGALQPLLGWVGASFLFGLAHAVTFGYFVIATLMGAFLGKLFIWTESLWAPIVTHALYDIFALTLLKKELSKNPSQADSRQPLPPGFDPDQE